MFQNLQHRLGEVFAGLRRRGTLSPEEVERGLREIRLALLEADVSLPVVKEFTARIREKALSSRVVESLNPVQQLVGIVYQELVDLLGGPAEGKEPLAGGEIRRLMLVGLQGSGKTTTAAKLALRLMRLGRRPLLVACDLKRPQAVLQLVTLGEKIGVPVYSPEDAGGTDSPLEVARSALERARREDRWPVIFDTAGRLSIDEEMMAELRELASHISPDATWLVVDAMTGQDALTTAENFHRQVGIDGVVLSKFDSDARAGAALSIRSVTGRPLLYLGVGERVEDLEPFYPERVASRILGMGDVASLAEKVRQEVDLKEAKGMERRLLEGRFNLDDYRAMLLQVRRLGPLSKVLQMVPGLRIDEEMAEQGEKGIRRILAILDSMTPEERRRPEILNASRRRRIALGSGTSVQEVNRMLRQFKEMRRLMKRASKKGLRGVIGSMLSRR